MEKPVEIVASTRYIRVFREDGSMLSQHLTIEDAIESAVNAGGGNYQVVYPERVVRVSKAYGILSPGADTVPPTQPQGLSGYATGPTSIQLSWSPSTDNVGVIGYQVYKNGVPLPATETVSMLVSGLSPGTQYQFSVSAFDAAGNSSLISTSILVTTEANSPPVWSNPGTQGLTIGVPYSLSLTGYVTDADAVTISMSSGILPNGVGFNPGTGIVSGIPTTAQTVTATFTASDGVFTPVSQPIQFEVLNADTTAPSQPQNLIGEGTGGERIELTWNASTDPTVAGARTSGVSGYKLYRDGLLRDSIGIATSYSDTQVAAGIEYSYTVSAVDHANNESAQSTAAVASTGAFGWTIPDAPYVTSGPWYSQTAGQVYGVAQHANLAGVTPVYSITSQKKASVTGDYGFTIDASTGVLSVPSTLAEPVAPATTDSYTVSVDLQPLVTATDLTTLTLLASSTDASAPWMAGVAFAKGAVPAGVGLVTSEASSSVVVKRRWNDGSAKHAVVCGLSSLTAGVGKQVSLQAGTRGGTALTAASIQAAAPTASVQLGANGTVMLGSLLASPFRTWVSTPDMVECHYRASVTADLAVWFHVRLWSNGRLWVRAIAENGYTTGSPTTQAYVATVIIGGSTVYSASVNHYAFTRWTATGWVGTAATVRTAHVPAELIATRLVPNYWKRSPSATKLNAQVRTYAPMQLSPQPVSMGDAGFGEYIGVLPNWSALFVTSADARAYDATLVASNTLNSYSICRRSAATNRLSRPSDFPTFGLGDYSSSNPLGTWEVAHLVNEGYAAYLATGDYWHLETLGFNASYCYLTISTTNGQGVNKILRGETRAVGWMLNVVGHYCSIAPVEGEAAADSAIVSDYQTLLANNVAHWSSQIGVSGQNQLGSPYQYSLGAWSGTGSVAPWMTDFWVIVNGALCKMDPLPTMTSWQALRDWMYRWIVGRFGPTGSENFHFSRGGSEYGINISASNSTDPTTFFDSWGAVWTATFGSPNAETTNTLYSTNPGASNDPAYASGNHRWGVAVAAFAYAVDDSASGVSAAWSRFTGASNWSAIEGSNFSDVPLWGIVPSGYGGT